MKHVNAYPFVGKDYEKGFIIVWGYGLFDRLCGLGETDGEEMSLTNRYDGRILEWRRWSFL